MNFVSNDLAEKSAGRVTPLPICSLILLLALTSLAGCRTYLMATPNLYVNGPDDPFAELAPEFRSHLVEVMYATDRMPTTDSEVPEAYGSKRSAALEFGICTVALGSDWPTLARASRKRLRLINIPLSVNGFERITRFPEVPYAKTGDETETLKEKQSKVNERLAKLLRNRPRKEAFIYIHGVNNSFEQAAMVMAQLWHFMGRQGVPIIYSWPARLRVIPDYAYDRESGEFTIFHLKQFLRTIARSDLTKIHLIAHSRGTDVLMTALRELHIENRLADDKERLDLKIENVILAAPDIDLEVSSQRLAAEQLESTCNRLTVYLAQDDRAIAFARWLFSSLGRLGGFEWSQLSAEQQEYLTSLGFLTLVDARVEKDFIGHSYFYSNPAVSSDLIRLLRDGAAPNDPRRNLKPTRPPTNFWEIRPGYQRNRKD